MNTHRMISLGLLVLIMVISGCAGPSSTEKTKTLTLWYWNRSLDDGVIKAAEQQFPGIRINAQKIGGDFRSKIKTTLAAGSGGPDIVAINDWVAELFNSSEHFYDLYDLGAEEIQPDYLDWKWNLGVSPDGVMVALPIDTGPTALYYRADLFEEAGLPTDPEAVHEQMGTWDQYFEAGQQLQEHFNDQVKMLDNINNIYTQYIAQSEHIYFNEDGTFIGEDPNSSMKPAWDTAVKAAEMKLSANVTTSSSEWNAAMNNGRVASFVGAVWMKEILMDAAPDTEGKWRTARAPGGDGNNGGSFLAIMNNSQYPQEAFDVISWIQNPDNQVEAFTNINLFPSATKSLDTPIMKQEEPFFGNQATGEVFSESAQNVKSVFFGDKYANINGIVGRELTSVGLQGKNPDRAWADALARSKKELLR
ncbi:extracellular solute-binding protein [Paenibacillus sp. JCM 10914]|uniref:ABC transporter substrate-binding protein n=1 Tax=Paenibacillus sp. JCM 10914 TaxID=1236974 RepID=UPI0003CCA0E7|nr:extracellular solute-binding protein [Paenibacillus sp. JCM 10914]GAE05119.1 sugar ABC transporter substrate-binding protein [Paenibacillus sp. JCM 10914]